MAWIKSHQELGRHPKTKKLSRLLGVPLPAAVGHLHYLWWWIVDYATEGELGTYDSFDVADAALWEGDPEHFFSSLVESGFVDEYYEGEQVLYRIHDWMDYSGNYESKKAKNAERMREKRAREKQQRVMHVQRTNHAHTNDGDERAEYVQDTTIARTGARSRSREEKIREDKNTGDAERASAREEIVFELEKLLGKPPTQMQIELFAAYTEPEIGMEPELVLRAIRSGALASDGIKYAMGTLKKQNERGIKTVAQAEMDDTVHQAASASKLENKPARGSSCSRDKPVEPDSRYSNFYELFPEEAKK